MVVVDMDLHIFPVHDAGEIPDTAFLTGIDQNQPSNAIHVYMTDLG